MKRNVDHDFMLAAQLEQVIGNHIGKRQWEFILLARAWGDVVGERAAAHTLPAWIKKDVLFAYVDGSSWMQELTFMKPQILQQLKSHVRSVVIKDIKWLQQPLETAPLPAQELPPAKREVNPQNEKEFRHMTQIIGDPGCQQALFHLWRSFQEKMR